MVPSVRNCPLPYSSSLQWSSLQLTTLGVARIQLVQMFINATEIEHSKNEVMNEKAAQVVVEMIGWPISHLTVKERSVVYGKELYRRSILPLQ